MSVETKIQQLLGGKKQLSEAEEVDLGKQGAQGENASKDMKKDTSKSASTSTAGDTEVKMQGSSEKPVIQKALEDEKNLGSKMSSGQSDAGNKASIKMKGDAKSAKVPAMEETETEEEVITEIDISEELNAIFGEDLSEEFKKKATSIFEASVIARVNNEMEAVVQKLEEQNASDLVEYKESLVEKVDGYLNYVVEEWVKDNQIAIDNGLKNEITEEFISGLKVLFKENYIEVPEEKYDVINDLTDKIESLTVKLDETIDDNVELATQLVDFSKQTIISEQTEGLAATEADKLKTLVEGVEYDTPELFAEKINVIKENYFPKETKKSPEQNLMENNEAVDPEGPAENSVMSKYMSAITRQVASK